MNPKIIRYILLVVTIALFSLLGGLDVPKWIFFPALGIYVCGFFSGIMTSLEEAK